METPTVEAPKLADLPVNEEIIWVQKPGEIIDGDCSDPKGYGIKVAAGANLTLQFGFELPNALIDFQHPKLAGKLIRHLEFKHTSANGSKHWTSRPGFFLIFIVPKSAFKLVVQKRFSYPEIMLGEHKIALNVCAGGGLGPTLDYIDESPLTSINYPAKLINAVADIALSPENFGQKETDPVKLYDKYDIENNRREDWLKLAAAKLVKLKKGMRVVMAADVNYYRGETLTIENMSSNAQSLLLKADKGGNIHATRSCIDWSATAKLNNIEVKFPEEFSYLPLGRN